MHQHGLAQQLCDTTLPLQHYHSGRNYHLHILDQVDSNLQNFEYYCCLYLSSKIGIFDHHIFQAIDATGVFVDMTTGAPGIANVYIDSSPSLGGNLNVLSRTIYSSTSEIVKFDTNVAIKNSTIAPSYTGGYNVVYAQTPSSGGSGIYISNSTAQQQELVTKTKAIVFALIM